MENTGFEILRERLADLEPARDFKDRKTSWILPRCLGVARDPAGGFEIFIVGPRLTATSSLVERHLRHGEWKARNEPAFEANRIVLRREDHFAAIATTIAVELRRSGLKPGSNAQQPFTAVEPLIELALRRGALTEEVIVGLFGELLSLAVMLRAVRDRPELRSQTLDVWRGYQRSARDICLGEVVIEIKTTRGESSSHHINSLAQVEPQSDEQERQLFLLSIGLRAAEGAGASLPAMVEEVFELLAEGNGRSVLQERFLDNVRCYGTGQAIGYDHDTMSDWPAYEQKYVKSFQPRLFDMMDDAVRVVRKDDIAGTHVNHSDIQYGIDLPERISSLNPAHDWEHELSRLTRERFGLD